MLYNRQRELSHLDTRYANRRAELVILYGRRRVGKTSLIYHWIQGKPHLFFFATQDDNATLLRRFSQAIQQALGQVYEVDFTYSDWERALQALLPLVTQQRFIVVIDEFPRLVAAYPPIASYLQMVWDMALQHTKIFLILTGSLLSVMRQQALLPEAPLYLRHTWPFELKPLTVQDLPAFFPTYTPPEIIELYAVLGGMPYYLLAVDSTADLLGNIRQSMLAPTGSLFNEISLQMHLEMQGKDVALYMRILRAIAQGAHTRSDILQAASLPEKNLSHYLLNLQTLGLVTAKRPLERSQDQQRWARYHLLDPFLMFWQRYVAPRQAELEIGLGQEAAWQEIRLQLPRIVAPMWEQIAQWHILSQARQPDLPPITEVGSWWSRHAQIDVLGLDRHTRSVIFGEARWRQEPFTPRHLEQLMSRGQHWLRGSDAYWDVHYAIYARNPSPELKHIIAQERNVHLFTPTTVVNQA